ncbi:MAG: VPLPA-CTERM sorting domain-containing protein [Chromatiales bacterium]|nr:VPLPA-CTERM sorting domain-containing protein [Chromatiales bacterium]
MLTLRSATNTLCALAAVLLGITAFAPSANAALVTLRSVSPSPRHNGALVGNGVIEFTYEDSTPDIFPDEPFLGRYENPLAAGRITMGSTVFDLDTSMPSHIQIAYGAFSVTGPPFQLQAFRLGGTFIRSGDNTPFLLRWTYEGYPIETDALTALIGLSAAESYLLLEHPNPGPEDGEYKASAWGRLTLVPIPAAAWLFGSALGVMGWMRRKLR